jgi:hypothetical protein
MGSVGYARDSKSERRAKSREREKERERERRIPSVVFRKARHGKTLRR